MVWSAESRLFFVTQLYATGLNLSELDKERHKIEINSKGFKLFFTSCVLSSKKDDHLCFRPVPCAYFNIPLFLGARQADNRISPHNSITGGIFKRSVAYFETSRALYLYSVSIRERVKSILYKELEGKGGKLRYEPRTTNKLV